MNLINPISSAFTRYNFSTPWCPFANGLIRQYIPKDTDLRILSILDIVFVEKRLNKRPRKCISYDQSMIFLKNCYCTL